MNSDFPQWLDALSGVSLLTAVACSAVIAFDEIRRPQDMWIMNLVWPLTALFGGVLWLAFYWGFGRGPRPGATMPPHSNGQNPPSPMPVAVAKAASHCGAGCALGDLIAEWAALAFPALAVGLGWGSIFAEKTFAVWILDYLVAFVLGIGFQYFTIKPMRDLSAGEGVMAALKADAASITSWQVGMYGAMAVIQFLWFRTVHGGIAGVASTEFWFAMQLAMLAGFATAFPVNWALIRFGLKERM